MLARCSSCGTFGEVDLLPVPNGAQRVLCPSCSDGWGPPHLPDPARFRLLVGRLRDGTLAPSEERDLRFALDGLSARHSKASKTARILLRELMEKSLMNPFRPRSP